MPMNKKRAVVICPGRGTYNKDELGYLKTLHADKNEFIHGVDKYRQSQQQITVSDLDSMEDYSMRIHTAGENASALIYACAMADFQSINTEEYEVVAVTGNSMGWYIALAAAGAISPENAIELINSMGSMMTDGVIGGQLIYPIVDEHWHKDKSLVDLLDTASAKVNQLDGADVHISIELGGYRVFGGNDKGLTKLTELLPVLDDKYPMKLFNHAAFHTPLLQEIADKAQEQLGANMFQSPLIPMIDGLGNIWQPYSTDIDKLHHYTLQRQVVEPYQFSKAIEIAIKEFAPDKLIILGPGATLGGAVAQCLIEHQWQGNLDKQSFIVNQNQDPFLLAMGIGDQRKQVVA